MNNRKKLVLASCIAFSVLAAGLIFAQRVIAANHETIHNNEVQPPIASHAHREAPGRQGHEEGEDDLAAAGHSGFGKIGAFGMVPHSGHRSGVARRS